MQTTNRAQCDQCSENLEYIILWELRKESN